MAGQKPKRPLSGGAKLKAAGKKALMLALRPEQYEKIKTAALIEMRPMSQFVTFYAVQAAEKVVELG